MAEINKRNVHVVSGLAVVNGKLEPRGKLSEDAVRRIIG